MFLLAMAVESRQLIRGAELGGGRDGQQEAGDSGKGMAKVLE